VRTSASTLWAWAMSTATGAPDLIVSAAEGDVVYVISGDI
jgi:hypothetical protein